VDAGSHDRIEPARTAILRVIAERHDNEEDVTVLTQDAVLSAFSRILGMLTAALAGIAAISLSVAGLGIMNVMLVSVSERTHEIGLLKALGASRGQVLAVFLVEAAIIATAGGVAGLGVAYLATRGFALVYPAFPIDPPGWAVAAALGVSMSVGIIFGALPARRAARLDPVAALTRR
jgi:putative ABC transport system permease protein